MPIMAYNLLPILVGISLIIGTYSGHPVAFVLGALGVFFSLLEACRSTRCSWQSHASWRHGGLAIAVALLGTVLTALTGIVAASGTLGILIPLSIMMLVLGSMLQVSVGDLFKTAFAPGLLLGALYLG